VIRDAAGGMPTALGETIREFKPGNQKDWPQKGTKDANDVNDPIRSVRSIHASRIRIFLRLFAATLCFGRVACPPLWVGMCLDPHRLRIRMPTQSRETVPEFREADWPQRTLKSTKK
jgi:hypothetical protein